MAKWQFYFHIFQSATLPFPPNAGVTYNVFNHLGQMRSFSPTEPGFSQGFYSVWVPCLEAVRFCLA